MAASQLRRVQWPKRGIDIVLSAAALFLIWPALLLIALAVWIDSGPPVLFSQERVGRRFRRFTLWKFRSMRSANGPLITSSADTRVTFVGRILRRAKLDELPQLWNVLVGDMSLVGPRPELPSYVDQFHTAYERILEVRPGLTDPASIEYRDEERLLGKSSDPEASYIQDVLPAKLRLSEDYLSNWSLFLDLHILLRTVLVVVGLVRGRQRAEASDAQLSER